MKNIHILAWLTLVGIAFSCKTNEPQERLLSGRRMEIEAILHKHLKSMESSVSVNFEQLDQVLSDDNLVAHIDLTRFDNCIQQMVAHSHKRLTLMRESGCKQLMEQSLAFSGQDAVAFHEQHMDALSRCDSLQSVLLSEYAKEVVRPFSSLVEDTRKLSANHRK